MKLVVTLGGREKYNWPDENGFIWAEYKRFGGTQLKCECEGPEIWGKSDGPYAVKLEGFDLLRYLKLIGVA